MSVYDDLINQFPMLAKRLSSSIYKQLLVTSPITGPHFTKADDPVLTSTTGVLQLTYGEMAFDWVNREHNLFGVLPKRPWERSGWRVITADPTLPGGIGESAVIPDSVKPTYAALDTKPKQILLPYSYSDKDRKLAATGDDAIPPESELRAWAARAHALQIDADLFACAETACSAHWTGTDDFETIDRIISCDEEDDDLASTFTDCFDAWKKYATVAIDRDNATTYDSVVVHADGTVTPSASAFGTDATFNMEAVDTLISECIKKGADRRSQVMITGYDTYNRMVQLEKVKERYMNPVRAVQTVNGIQTMPGADAGMLVSSYQDIPIIVCQNCPKDGIQRIYLVDTRYLFIKLLTPTIFQSSTFPPQIDIGGTFGARLMDKHWFRTDGELICTNFKVQGKLRSAK